MLQKIMQAFCWLMEKVRTGVAWIRENRTRLEQQAGEICRQVHMVLIRAHRQVWAKFNQGRALAILTVLYRQEGNTSFRQGLEQAKAAVRAMPEAEIAHMVIEFFSEPAEAQMVNAAA